MIVYICIANLYTNMYLYSLYRFKEIGERLQQAPTSPQELASLTEYVQKISLEMMSLQQKIDTIMVCCYYPLPLLIIIIYYY